MVGQIDLQQSLCNRVFQTRVQISLSGLQALQAQNVTGSEARQPAAEPEAPRLACFTPTPTAGSARLKSIC